MGHGIRATLLVGWVLAACGGAYAADAPAYKLTYTPCRQIELVETHTIRLPGHTVKEWIFFQRLPYSTPRQDITLTASPDGQDGFAGGTPRQPLVFIRKVLSEPQRDPEITYTVIYRGTLNKTQLVPLAEGEKPPRVAPLTAQQRQHYTARTEFYDYDSPDVAGWLDKSDLRRHGGESDLDLSRRIFLSLRGAFTWTAKLSRNAKASEVVRAHGAVCVGLSHLYAAALRANGIPARSLSVRLAGDPKPDDNTENMGHAVNEFFIEGIGWLSADVTVDVSAGTEEASLKAFGGDGGYYLITDDADGSGWTVDTVHFGLADKKQPSADFRKDFPETVREKIDDAMSGFEWTGNGSGKSEHKDFYALHLKPMHVETGDCSGVPKFSVPNSCYSIYHDEAGWHLRSMPGKDTQSRHYEILITPDAGGIAKYRQVGQDKDAGPGRELKIDYTTAEIGGVDFEAGKEAKNLLFELKVDGKYATTTFIMLGRRRSHPSMVPFLLPASGQAPQTQPATPAGK